TGTNADRERTSEPPLEEPPASERLSAATAANSAGGSGLGWDGAAANVAGAGGFWRSEACRRLPLPGGPPPPRPSARMTKTRAIDRPLGLTRTVFLLESVSL